MGSAKAVGVLKGREDSTCPEYGTSHPSMSQADPDGANRSGGLDGPAKGCRDTLVELRLASDCMALDQRLKGIIGAVGARLPEPFEKHYETIEQELIERVAEPSGLTGGKLDRILFQNYGDIMVRLLCR